MLLIISKDVNLRIHISYTYNSYKTIKTNYISKLKFKLTQFNMRNKSCFIGTKLLLPAGV